MNKKGNNVAEQRRRGRECSLNGHIEIGDNTFLKDGDEGRAGMVLIEIESGVHSSVICANEWFDFLEQGNDVARIIHAVCSFEVGLSAQGVKSTHIEVEERVFCAVQVVHYFEIASLQIMEDVGVLFRGLGVLRRAMHKKGLNVVQCGLPDDGSEMSPKWSGTMDGQMVANEFKSHFCVEVR
jgi:hypothetical protein